MKNESGISLCNTLQNILTGPLVKSSRFTPASRITDRLQHMQISITGFAPID
jgi:hypothetical protein